MFEIGSVTKVFTALLLADMAQRGEVSLNEPLSALLPRDKVQVPQRNGRPITLADPSPTLTGAGFLHSTANDLMRFLEAMMGLRESPLAPAMKSMLATRRAGGVPPSTAVALGWMLGQEYRARREE